MEVSEAVAVGGADGVAEDDAARVGGGGDEGCVFVEEGGGPALGGGEC